MLVAEAIGPSFARWNIDEQLGPKTLGRARILGALLDQGVTTRAEIVTLTGLSRATVTGIVTDLIASGLVHEVDATTPGAARMGRPAQGLAVTGAAAYAFGAEIGSDDVRVVLCDANGHPIWDRRAAVDTDAASATFDRVAGLVDDALLEAEVARDEVVGLGAAVRSPVVRDGDGIARCPMLAGWDGVDPEAEIADRTALQTVLAKDANAGALGELRHGAGRGHKDMLYARLADGIGAGVVLDGRLRSGSRGVAGEIGHVSVVAGGRFCRCGNRGCLETVATPSALARQLEEGRGAPVTVQDLYESLAAGDRSARVAVQDAGTAIGRVLGDVVTVFNPTIVVLGGELTACGEALLGPVADAIVGYGLPAATATLDVVPAVLADRAEVVGAAALVLERAPVVLAQRTDAQRAASVGG